MSVKTLCHLFAALHFWFGCYYDWNYVKIPSDVHRMGSSFGKSGKLKFLTFWDAVCPRPWGLGTITTFSVVASSGNIFHDLFCKWLHWHKWRYPKENSTYSKTERSGNKQSLLTNTTEHVIITILITKLMSKTHVLICNIVAISDIALFGIPFIDVRWTDFLGYIFRRSRIDLPQGLR